MGIAILDVNFVLRGVLPLNKMECFRYAMRVEAYKRRLAYGATDLKQLYWGRTYKDACTYTNKAISRNQVCTGQAVHTWF